MWKKTIALIVTVMLLATLLPTTMSAETIVDTMPTEITEETAPVEATVDAMPTEITEETTSVEATVDAMPTEITEETTSAEVTADAVPTEITEETAAVETTADEVPTETTEETASTETTVDITINISVEGKLVVAAQTLTVSDQDSDGKITINDALIVAHNMYYDGGAAAGFMTEKTQYGLSIVIFWGIENGGSYGYYLNNASVSGLTDAIKSGDVLTAYTYADLTTWSDVYTFFNVSELTIQAGKEFTLMLNKISFDENWQIVTEPLTDATIVVNNSEVDAKTNEQGKVTLVLDKPGDYIVSAVSSDETIVPPACNVHVSTELEFVDVPEGAWYYDAIMFCAKNGLLKGRSIEMNVFAPDADMTVAEYLTIMYRLDKNVGLYGNYENTGANWQAAAKHVAEVLEFNFSNFNKPITRGEMATVTAAHLKAFAKYMGYKIIEMNAVAFNDTQDNPYKDDIAFIQRLGIIQGYGDGTYRPNNNVRRSEVGQIIYNYLNNEIPVVAE